MFLSAVHGPISMGISNIAQVGVNHNCELRLAVSIARRGLIGGAGACSLAAPASRLALEPGGARMCCARAKVSMMIIGAPQCRHTKVGCRAALAVWASLGAAGRTGGLMQEFASGGDLVLAVGVGG